MKQVWSKNNTEGEIVMCCKMLSYIFSLSLQIAASGILVVNYWRELNVLKLAYSNLETEDDFGDIDIGEENYLGEEKHKILINRFAFIELLLGYILSIWGEVENKNKNMVALIVIILAIIIGGITLFVTRKYAYQ